MGVRVLRVAATSVVAAAATVAVPPAVAPVAAAAAACSSATGVTAVVDFNELGGGVTAGCDADGGDRPASEVFRDAGYTLQYSQQPGMNGFVCKVQGKPADGDCTANDSFWSLWWSDGGDWVFSNEGVGSLDVPDGGYVAFAWHEGGGDAAPPDVRPTPHEDPAPDPSDSGGGGDDAGDNGGNGGQGAQGTGDRGDQDADEGAGGSGGSSSAAPSTAPPSSATTEAASPTATRTAERRKRRPAAAEPSPTRTLTPSSTLPEAGEITDGPPADASVDSAADDGGSLPTWVALGLSVVVLGAAGLVPLLRRRLR